jgi:O-antigen/teichoic acid export membrane protein
MPPEKHRIKHETEKQRWDRNFADLLQELRVAQTGIQILFAFLLTLPFSSGFPRTTAFQKDVYIVSLLSAAFATAMIIAPVAFHRALFRQGRKPELVRYAHRMATGGLAFLLVAMVAAVLLITDYLLAWPMTIILTAATGIFFLVFWALIPWQRRNWITDDDEEEDEAAGFEVATEDEKTADRVS